jgi:hypothetical protein
LTDDNGNLRPLGVKVGERVLFGKWAGTDVIIEGEDRLILKEFRDPRRDRKAARAYTPRPLDDGIARNPA